MTRHHTDWLDELLAWAISLIILAAIMTIVVIVPSCHGH